MKERNLKLGQLLWPLRAALTGRQYSPGAVEVAAVLGKETTVRRLKAATLTV
jgi:glutamyl-tRNA synthetase